MRKCFSVANFSIPKLVKNFSPLCITRHKPERGEAINIVGKVFKVPTVCVANTDAYRGKDTPLLENQHGGF